LIDAIQKKFAFVIRKKDERYVSANKRSKSTIKGKEERKTPVDSKKASAKIFKEEKH